MKRIVVAIAAGLGLGMVASVALAGGQQSQPTQAEIHEQALKSGPATPQIDYPTKKNAIPPYQGTSHADPKAVPPLSQREIGMLYNACIAYPECKTSYANAKEHEAELQRAKQQQAADGGH